MVEPTSENKQNSAEALKSVDSKLRTLNTYLTRLESTTPENIQLTPEVVNTFILIRGQLPTLEARIDSEEFAANYGSQVAYRKNEVRRLSEKFAEQQVRFGYKAAELTQDDLSQTHLGDFELPKVGGDSEAPSEALSQPPSSIEPIQVPPPSPDLQPEVSLVKTELLDISREQFLRFQSTLNQMHEGVAGLLALVRRVSEEVSISEDDLTDELTVAFMRAANYYLLVEEMQENFEALAGEYGFNPSDRKQLDDLMTLIEGRLHRISTLIDVSSPPGFSPLREAVHSHPQPESHGPDAHGKSNPHETATISAILNEETGDDIISSIQERIAGVVQISDEVLRAAELGQLKADIEKRIGQTQHILNTKPSLEEKPVLKKRLMFLRRLLDEAVSPELGKEKSREYSDTQMATIFFENNQGIHHHPEWKNGGWKNASPEDLAMAIWHIAVHEDDAFSTSHEALISSFHLLNHVVLSQFSEAGTVVALLASFEAIGNEWLHEGQHTHNDELALKGQQIIDHKNRLIIDFSYIQRILETGAQISKASSSIDETAKVVDANPITDIWLRRSFAEMGAGFMEVPEYIRNLRAFSLTAAMNEPIFHEMAVKLSSINRGKPQFIPSFYEYNSALAYFPEDKGGSGSGPEDARIFSKLRIVKRHLVMMEAGADNPPPHDAIVDHNKRLKAVQNYSYWRLYGDPSRLPKEASDEEIAAAYENIFTTVEDVYSEKNPHPDSLWGRFNNPKHGANENSDAYLFPSESTAKKRGIMAERHGYSMYTWGLEPNKASAGSMSRVNGQLQVASVGGREYPIINDRAGVMGVSPVERMFHTAAYDIKGHFEGGASEGSVGPEIAERWIIRTAQSFFDQGAAVEDEDRFYGKTLKQRLLTSREGGQARLEELITKMATPVEFAANYGPISDEDYRKLSEFVNHLLVVTQVRNSTYLVRADEADLLSLNLALEAEPLGRLQAELDKALKGDVTKLDFLKYDQVVERKNKYQQTIKMAATIYQELKQRKRTTDWKNIKTAEWGNGAFSTFNFRALVHIYNQTREAYYTNTRDEGSIIYNWDTDSKFDRYYGLEQLFMAEGFNLDAVAAGLEFEYEEKQRDESGVIAGSVRKRGTVTEQDRKDLIRFNQRPSDQHKIFDASSLKDEKGSRSGQGVTRFASTFHHAYRVPDMLPPEEELTSFELAVCKLGRYARLDANGVRILPDRYQMYRKLQVGYRMITDMTEGGVQGISPEDADAITEFLSYSFWASQHPVDAAYNEGRSVHEPSKITKNKPISAARRALVGASDAIAKLTHRTLRKYNGLDLFEPIEAYALLETAGVDLSVLAQLKAAAERAQRSPFLGMAKH